MAGSFNKVLLMGNLTRDVELRHLPSNMAVGKFGIAMNRQFKTADGQTRDEVTFVDCEVWGKTAETMSKFLTKGRPVFIEGRLKLDQWEDRESKEKRSRLLVVVENFRFVDSKPGSGGGGGGGGGADAEGGGEYQSRPTRTPAAVGGGSRGGPSPEDQGPMGEEDIPF